MKHLASPHAKIISTISTGCLIIYFYIYIALVAMLQRIRKGLQVFCHECLKLVQIIFMHSLTGKFMAMKVSTDNPV